MMESVQSSALKPKTSASQLKLFLFGPPRLELDGQTVQLDTRKAIALMAYLAVTRRRLSRDHLAGLLWPDADHAHAYGALRRTLSVLNGALGGAGLMSQRDSVAIAPELWCDVSEFRRLIKSSDLTSAIALHADDFMAGFTLRDSAPFEDWQLAEAELLQRELAEALGALAMREADADRVNDALAHARRWLALDPLHEAAHRLLMQLYARTGDRPAALRQYRECMRVLDEELGVPPLEETTALYEAIQAGELPAPSQPQAQASQKPAALVDAAGGALVGREEQWAALERAHQAAAQGGHVAVLEGEAGIGKTRLALDFLERARERGALVLTTTCYEGEAGLAYAPMLSIARVIAADPALTARLAELPEHVLAEGARLLPELGEARAELPPVQALNSPAAQLRFFDCIAQIMSAVLAPPLTAGQPSILFIDDAQWADETTLDLLAYIARRLRSQPVLLLFAWRGENVPPQHRLRHLFGQAAREHRATLIALSRLSLHSTHALLRDAFGDVDPGMTDDALQALAGRLQVESEGLPLFVTEYIAMMRNDPRAASNAAHGAWPMPQSVRDILRARLTSLDDASLQLLGAAAVIGRAFDGELLQQVSGRSEDETAVGLEHLTRAGLTREASANAGYDFIHDKLREVAYADLSLGRRRLLHRRAAEALLARGRGQHRANLLASQIAQHYRLAGKDAEAAAQFKLAGDHARSIFANAEALAHYRDALALGYPDSAMLHAAIADLHVLAGDYASAIIHYEMAAAQSSGAALADVEHRLGNVHHRRGEWALAEAHYQGALDLFGACDERDEPDPCARLLADWSLNAHRSGDARRAQALAERALALAERSGDPRALAQTHNILGVLARNRADLPKAITAFEQSLAFAQKLDEPTARVAALNNLGLALSDHGEQPRALVVLQEALALCASQGDRHRQAALHNNIADLRHAMGDQAGAMADLTQAVKLFADIGLDAHKTELQPEIWKLAEW